MTWTEALKIGEAELVKNEVPEAKLNAWYLFSYAFGCDRTRFFMDCSREAQKDKVDQYKCFLERRADREPLEHIIGETEFMGLPFWVSEDVLIPRQDTECLVEHVLPFVRGKQVLDLCTGSGCIGISLKVLGECSSMTLADISEKAIAIAKKNAVRNQADVMLVQGDLFENISGTYDVIVSNPPYIRTEEIRTLMPEVKDHEPLLALDGSEDGLLFYNSIIEQAPSYLEPEGILAFEIGYDQGEDVQTAMVSAGFSHVKIEKDLAGLNRIVSGRFGGKDV